MRKIYFLFLACLTVLWVGCTTPEETTEKNDVTVTALVVKTAVSTTAVSPNALPAASTPLPPAITNSQPEPEAPEPTETALRTPAPSSTTSDMPGALIQISMQGNVGILLDEFPLEMRDQVADEIISQPDNIWLYRAERQVRLTRLRLNFRNFAQPDKGQLPLPPSQLWEIQLDPAGASRQTIQNHDLIMMSYSISTTLLTDEASPAAAEPALAEIGGVWEEPFVFPADPDLLLQRTGNACINEGGFPPNSFDSENVWHFFDFDCEADSGGAVGCHRTQLPNLSCREALVERIGEVETVLRFERLRWDTVLADSVRVGPVTNQETPDLLVVGDDLENNRISYRYVEPENCALEEHAVEDNGWRRLLQFDATVYNVGGKDLHIGPIAAIDPENNVFEYNPCHDHFHYSNYGDFFLQNLDQLIGSKQAFCVQSTNRHSNNESAPLTHDYSCRSQGVQAGWVDEYIAGLDAQWIDITDLNIPENGRTVQLGFRSNGDQFLCEGDLVVDSDGNQVWEPSGFTTDDGLPINRPLCEFNEDWDDNNESIREVFIPATGSFVTAPCLNNESGPLRNCGFTEMERADTDQICQPGEAVSLPVRVDDSGLPQVLRVCERSAVLGTGVACTFEDAITNSIVSAQPTEVGFICPSIKDASDEDDQPGGGYALMAAPVWPNDDLSPLEFVIEEN